MGFSFQSSDNNACTSFSQVGFAVSDVLFLSRNPLKIPMPMNERPLMITNRLDCSLLRAQPCTEKHSRSKTRCFHAAHEDEEDDDNKRRRPRPAMISNNEPIVEALITSNTSKTTTINNSRTRTHTQVGGGGNTTLTR